MLTRKSGTVSGFSSCRMKAEALARAFNTRVWPCLWIDRPSGDEMSGEDDEFYETSPSPIEDFRSRGRDYSAATESGRAKLYELLHRHAADDATEVFYDVSEHAVTGDDVTPGKIVQESLLNAELSSTVENDICKNGGITNKPDSDATAKHIFTETTNISRKCEHSDSSKSSVLSEVKSTYNSDNNPELSNDNHEFRTDSLNGFEYVNEPVCHQPSTSDKLGIFNSDILDECNDVNLYAHDLSTDKLNIDLNHDSVLNHFSNDVNCDCKDNYFRSSTLQEPLNVKVIDREETEVVLLNNEITNSSFNNDNTKDATYTFLERDRCTPFNETPSPNLENSNCDDLIASPSEKENGQHTINTDSEPISIKISKDSKGQEYTNCNSSGIQDSSRLNVFQEERPVITRSTSLKTGKTPPGTPSKKKIVRFADVLGLDLEDVRHIISGDLPNIPPSAFQDLVLPNNRNTTTIPDAKTVSIPSLWCGIPGPASGHNSLYPNFSIPGQQPDFMSKVRCQGICLESILVSEFNVQCMCRVMNWGYLKKVTARYTVDKWSSSTDIDASYISGSTQDGTDCFAFNLFLNPQHKNVQFALRYTVNGNEYWDSNGGMNYSLSYHGLGNEMQDSIPASPTWCHQFW